MLIGGLQKFSMIDYPGKTCAIVFTVGCNFRCPYCHNPELQDGVGCQIWNEDDVLKFLETRKGELDAVTITGGEPTLHDDLPDFLRKIKAMGFLIKLDSNGTRPRMLKKIFKEGLVDYHAMDIKGSYEKYSMVSGVVVDRVSIEKSIKLIMDMVPNYEFRTTIVKSQLAKEDFYGIGELIKGAKRYYLQKFIPSKTLDKSFMNETTYSDEEFEELREIMLEYVDECEVR